MSAPDLLSEALWRALAPRIEELVAERVAEALAARDAAPDLLNVSEAASMLRAPRQRVYDLLDQGRLEKDGARVLIPRSSLEAHLGLNGRSATVTLT